MTSKYTEQTKATIAEMLRDTGSDAIAFKTAGISKNTYYRWIQEYEEFSVLTEEAKFEYLQGNKKILRVLAFNALYKALTRGSRSIRTVRKRVPGKSKKMVVIEEVVTEVDNGVPQWAIERVLGKMSDELESVNKLVEVGWYSEEAATSIAEQLEDTSEKVKEILTRHAIE